MKVYTVVRMLGSGNIVPLKSFLKVREAEDWTHLQARLLDMRCKYFISEWEFHTPICDKSTMIATNEKTR